MSTMNVSMGSFHCSFAPWRPADGRIFEFFAYDTETTDLDEDRPYLTPTYVLGAACDGQRGVFIPRDHVVPFFQAHQDVPFIMHNAAFDLKVTDVLLKSHLDLYHAVDTGQVWDTLILNRLYYLAIAGHTARGESSLAHCAATHLSIKLEKAQQDAQGNQVRTSFGKFLGKPPSAIPAQYLQYLAQDAMATWHLFRVLNRLIRNLLENASHVWGFVNEEWLRDVCNRFGPLTHHIQLRASILMDVLRSNGIGIDQERCQEKSTELERIMEECKERMRSRGFLAGEKNNGKALQSILSQFQRENPDIQLKRTPSGQHWSTAAEDLAELAAHDPFFVELITYRTAEKLRSTYLRKMGQPRLHPKFGYLLETGRTYCGGGFNLQNLPRESNQDSPANTVRGCFVPKPGHVFIDCDYSQIELVVLAHAIQHQFGWDSRLAKLINSNEDVHRLLAATVLDKPVEEITKAERNSVKAVSFGRPGGMGVNGLRRVAKVSYNLEFTDEEIQERIDAYHQLCPELDQFLRDEIDVGAVLAQRLHLTPGQYYRATGRFYDPQDPAINLPASWLGAMLLKVLREPTPMTRGELPRTYTQEEIDFLWDCAQRLSIKLDPRLQAKLDNRDADPALRAAVRTWAGRRPVFTHTGRLRANTTFNSSHNTIFQGPAADGALLGLWHVWRAGYTIVDFVHDQLVVEAPADDRVIERVHHIEELMKQGMLEVIPGMKVKVESVITCSLNKAELDPRYVPNATQEQKNGRVIEPSVRSHGEDAEGCPTVHGLAI